LALCGQADERVLRAQDLIERDPWSSASAPAALAAAVGLSRRRLEQVFASTLGHGIGEERDRRRVEWAQTLLGRRDLPVKEIAQRSGFASGAAFSTWFRRHAGMAPKDFRGGGRIGI
jgi:transcriptional regulator GlxA family with amidase domain